MSERDVRKKERKRDRRKERKKGGGKEGNCLTWPQLSLV